MLFNSLTFLVFFAIVFALHGLLRGWTARKRLLLVGSYVFYAAWNPPYVAILLFSTAMDWWLARLIWQSDDDRRRKRLLLVSLVCNLSLLGFFKYGDFLLHNFQALGATIGVVWQPPRWSIVLPIGISFYTFASLSYTIDVYRREVKGDWSLLDYALFVSFFPHLVAGPIVRARKLLPQIAEPRRATSAQVGWGLVLVVIGLFAKTVLADSVFAPVVDTVYIDPAQHGAADTWAAVLGFSGQIYYDFAGYSLCAIGLALCFGFEFPDNFRFPYAARGFSDFWRRWHVSLSSWLRDYLYIPLGGNRGGELKTYRNLMLTMLLGGLWHGASWMYVLWGGLHGLWLSLERRFGGSDTAERREGKPVVVVTLVTFLVVTLTWIPFRAIDAAAVLAVVNGLARFDVASTLPAAQLATCILAMLATVIWQFAMRDRSLEEAFERIGTLPATAAIGACLIGLYLCSGGDQRAFIYFQF
ncbi:MAG TPA: MBOAT family O-acyltransferase [Rhodanobacteraceae bacterium]|nr:MBOAT family O-acyltransferase [Rhodanobacteraceae bacterium]